MITEYIPKGKEKHFLKLSEIREHAEQVAKDKKKARIFYKKIFGGISNETAIDFANDAEKKIQTISQNDDPISKATDLCDILFKAYCAMNLKSFKDKKFDEVLDQARQIYFDHCEIYVNAEIGNFPDISLKECRDALAVLNERGFQPAPDYLTAIGRFETAKPDFDKIEKALSDPEIVSNSEQMSGIAKEYRFYENLFIDDKLLARCVLPLKNRIQTWYKKQVGDLEREISVAEGSQKTHAEQLLLLYQRHINVEDSFGQFSSEFETRKYNTIHSSLKRSYQRLRQEYEQIAIEADALQQSSDLERIHQLRERVDQTQRTIEYQYKEYREIAENLVKISDKAEKQLRREVNVLLSESLKKIKPGRGLKVHEQIAIWDEVVRVLRQERQTHPKIIYLTEQVDKNLIILNDQILTFLSQVPQDYKPDQGVAGYLSLLEFCSAELQRRGELETVQRLTEELRRLTQISKTFQADLKQAQTALIELNKALEHNDETSLIKKFYEIKLFFAKIDKHCLLIYPDYSEPVRELKREWQSFAKKVHQILEKRALHEQFSLTHSASKNRYLILTNPVFRIGCWRDEGVGMIRDGLLLIPWKRISGQHLEIDFKQAELKDLKSANGTYTPDLIQKSITIHDLKGLKEFNLAQDMTFKIVSAEKNHSFLFIFQEFTNSHDWTNGKLDLESLKNILSHLHIIYLREDASLFIEKESGAVTFESPAADNFVEVTRTGKYFTFSDAEYGFKDEVLSALNIEYFDSK